MPYTVIYDNDVTGESTKDEFYYLSNAITFANGSLNHYRNSDNYASGGYSEATVSLNGPGFDAGYGTLSCNKHCKELF